MPAPVSVNIAAASRSGHFESAIMNNPGGFVAWAGNLTGLGSGVGSDYENPANQLDIGIFYEDPNNLGTYILYSGFHWKGGPASNHAGASDPLPSFSVGLGNLPIGNVKVAFDLTGTFTVGLSSTLS